MRVLLVSTYELGHQPVHVASPAAALRAAGHDVRALDVSVEPWDATLVEWADSVAFSVPMHTAMRMALVLAGSVRVQRPELPVCLYGLYAGISRDATTAVAAGIADKVIAGEYEPALVAWAGASAPGGADGAAGDGDGRGLVPRATPLCTSAEAPSSPRHATCYRRWSVTPRLVLGDEERLAGAVEASHGCSHRCRHCPLPVVYDGRLRIVAEDVVVADVAQLEAMGAAACDVRGS